MLQIRIFYLIVISYSVVPSMQKSIYTPTTQNTTTKSLSSLYKKHWRPNFRADEEATNVPDTVTIANELYVYNKPVERKRFRLESRTNALPYKSDAYAEDLLEKSEQFNFKYTTAMENDLRIRQLMEELVMRSRLVDKEINILDGLQTSDYYGSAALEEMEKTNHESEVKINQMEVEQETNNNKKDTVKVNNIQFLDQVEATDIEISSERQSNEETKKSAHMEPSKEITDGSKISAQIESYNYDNITVGIKQSNNQISADSKIPSQAVSGEEISAEIKISSIVKSSNANLVQVETNNSISAETSTSEIPVRLESVDNKILAHIKILNQQEPNTGIPVGTKTPSHVESSKKTLVPVAVNDEISTTTELTPEVESSNEILIDSVEITDQADTADEKTLSGIKISTNIESNNETSSHKSADTKTPTHSEFDERISAGSQIFDKINFSDTNSAFIKSHSEIVANNKISPQNKSSEKKFNTKIKNTIQVGDNDSEVSARIEQNLIQLKLNEEISNETEILAQTESNDEISADYDISKQINSVNDKKATNANIFNTTATNVNDLSNTILKDISIDTAVLKDFLNQPLNNRKKENEIIIQNITDVVDVFYQHKQLNNSLGTISEEKNNTYNLETHKTNEILPNFTANALQGKENLAQTDTNLIQHTRNALEATVDDDYYEHKKLNNNLETLASVQNNSKWNNAGNNSVNELQNQDNFVYNKLKHQELYTSIAALANPEAIINKEINENDLRKQLEFLQLNAPHIRNYEDVIERNKNIVDFENNTNAIVAGNSGEIKNNNPSNENINNAQLKIDEKVIIKSINPNISAEKDFVTTDFPFLHINDKSEKPMLIGDVSIISNNDSNMHRNNFENISKNFEEIMEPNCDIEITTNIVLSDNYFKTKLIFFEKLNQLTDNIKGDSSSTNNNTIKKDEELGLLNEDANYMTTPEKVMENPMYDTSNSTETINSYKYIPFEAKLIDSGVKSSEPVEKMIENLSKPQSIHKTNTALGLSKIMHENRLQELHETEVENNTVDPDEITAEIITIETTTENVLVLETKAMGPSTSNESASDLKKMGEQSKNSDELTEALTDENFSENSSELIAMFTPPISLNFNKSSDSFEHIDLISVNSDELSLENITPKTATEHSNEFTEEFLESEISIENLKELIGEKTKQRFSEESDHLDFRDMINKNEINDFTRQITTPKVFIEKLYEFTGKNKTSNMSTVNSNEQIISTGNVTKLIEETSISKAQTSNKEIDTSEHHMEIVTESSDEMITPKISTEKSAEQSLMKGTLRNSTKKPDELTQDMTITTTSIENLNELGEEISTLKTQISIEKTVEFEYMGMDNETNSNELTKEITTQKTYIQSTEELTRKKSNIRKKLTEDITTPKTSTENSIESAEEFSIPKLTTENLLNFTEEFIAPKSEAFDEETEDLYQMGMTTEIVSEFVRPTTPKISIEKLNKSSEMVTEKLDKLILLTTTEEYIQNFDELNEKTDVLESIDLVNTNSEELTGEMKKQKTYSNNTEELSTATKTIVAEVATKQTQASNKNTGGSDTENSISLMREATTLKPSTESVYESTERLSTPRTPVLKETTNGLEQLHKVHSNSNKLPEVAAISKTSTTNNETDDSLERLEMVIKNFVKQEVEVLDNLNNNTDELLINPLDNATNYTTNLSNLELEKLRKEFVSYESNQRNKLQIPTIISIKNGNRESQKNSTMQTIGAEVSSTINCYTLATMVQSIDSSNKEIENHNKNETMGIFEKLTIINAKDDDGDGNDNNTKTNQQQHKNDDPAFVKQQQQLRFKHINSDIETDTKVQPKDDDDSGQKEQNKHEQKLDDDIYNEMKTTKMSTIEKEELLVDILKKDDKDPDDKDEDNKDNDNAIYSTRYENTKDGEMTESDKTHDAGDNMDDENNMTATTMSTKLNNNHNINIETANGQIVRIDGIESQMSHLNQKYNKKNITTLSSYDDTDDDDILKYNRKQMKIEIKSTQNNQNMSATTRITTTNEEESKVIANVKDDVTSTTETATKTSITKVKTTALAIARSTTSTTTPAPSSSAPPQYYGTTASDDINEEKKKMEKLQSSEITTTNWWHTLPYTEIRNFLNTIFESAAAQELYEEIARKSKEIQNGQMKEVKEWLSPDVNDNVEDILWSFL